MFSPRLYSAALILFVLSQAKTAYAQLSPLPSSVSTVTPAASDSEAVQGEELDTSRPVRSQPGGLNPIVSDAYRLTNGDTISLWVANVPEYSTQYQVLGNGTVNLPVLGAVQVWGLTLDEAAVRIAAAYETAEILVEPAVTAVLAGMNPLRIAVVGEVGRPGSYVLGPMNGEAPTLTTAIENAGGVTESSDLKAVQIYRLAPDHSQTLLEASLWDLLNDGDLSQDIVLQDGDTIVLTRAEGLSFSETNQIASASFSSGVIRVNVVGEAVQPGMITVPADMSLNEVLLMAGGFGPDANESAVGLFRLAPNGTIDRQKVEIDWEATIGTVGNPTLRDRDIIVIGQSTGSRARDISLTITDIIGTVLNPISGILSIFDLFNIF